MQSLLKGIFQESHLICVLFVLQALSHLGVQSRFGEIKPMLAALALYEESIDFFPLITPYKKDIIKNTKQCRNVLKQLFAEHTGACVD